jgi:homoserine dehydrogenase
MRVCSLLPSARGPRRRGSGASPRGWCSRNVSGLRPSTRDVPIALLGYGTVGSAVDRHLREHAGALEAATGMHLRVVHALVRDPRKERPYPPLPGVLVTEFATIRDDPQIVAVAELMGGLEPAHDYIGELIERGKGVATANKQLLARAVGLLPRVRAGGSVCGAMPILSLLRDGIPAGSVERISGIVNGTTNFVLTRIECGSSYDEALAEAQAHGYAEADATEDVTGADAAAKIAILAATAFRTDVTIADVSYEGIERVDVAAVRHARASGRAIRLVGVATRDRAEVRLRELDASDPLAAAPSADNVVVVEGAGFRRISLSGPGAGGPETASAVVADLLELVR